MTSIELPLRLLLAIFTCYRLARLIARDDGPLYLFEHIRQWAQAKADKEAYNLGKWHSLADGLTCAYCLGVWFSIPILFMVLYPTFYGDVFLILMTISGVQAFLWGVVSK